MAQTFLKPETIVRTALGLLQRELILPRLVTRFGISDFRGAKDDTINVRLPAIATARDYQWRTRTAPIVVDELEEISVPVTLDKHPYSAVAVTDEELTLDIADFGEQVLAPQIRAVAEKLEGYIATAMSGGDYAETIDYDAGTDDFWDDVIVEARKKLNQANVPSTGRVLVLGANLEAEALKTDLFKQADQSGSTSVLENAILGRKAGFTVVGNVNSIDADLGYAFHQSAFAFGNVAPAVPEGASFGRAETYQGLAMRWLRDYDPDYLRDRSVVSSFAGAASVEDSRDETGSATGQNVRAVKITSGADPSA